MLHAVEILYRDRCSQCDARFDYPVDPAATSLVVAHDQGEEGYANWPLYLRLLVSSPTTSGAV